MKGNLTWSISGSSGGSNSENLNSGIGENEAL